MSKSGEWHLWEVPPATKQSIKVFAVKNNITIGQALEQIVKLAGI